MSMFDLLQSLGDAHVDDVLVGMNAESNLRLLREIEANRAFILAAYQQNPDLLARAEPRIRQLLKPLPAGDSCDAQSWSLDLFQRSEP
jgi:hypothetical protein